MINDVLSMIMEGVERLILFDCEHGRSRPAIAYPS